MYLYLRKYECQLNAKYKKLITKRAGNCYSSTCAYYIISRKSK